MKKALFPVLLLMSILLLCGCAEDILHLEEGTPSDLTVDELIAKMKKATDPKNVYADAKSYYMKQRLTSDNVNGSDESVSEIFWRAPGYMKQISYRNGEVINIIVTHQNRSWYVNPRTKKSREITGKDAQLVKVFSDIATPGLDYRKIFHTVTVDRVQSGPLTSVKTHDSPKSDRWVYRLICRVENPEIAPYVFYIEPKTWLTDRCETILYGPDGSSRLYIADSEAYEFENDVCMPKKTIITVDGKKDVADTVVFTLNPEIPLSTFDLEKPWNHEKEVEPK